MHVRSHASTALETHNRGIQFKSRNHRNVRGKTQADIVLPGHTQASPLTFVWNQVQRPTEPGPSRCYGNGAIGKFADDNTAAPA